MSSPFSAFGNQQRPPMNIAPRGFDMGQAQKFYQAMANSKNPMQAIDQLLSSNPRLAPIKNLMKQGRTPESIFRAVAAQRGIDPDDFVRQLQQGNSGK